MSNQYPATTQVPKAPTDTDINKAILDLLSKINSTNEYTDEQIASLKDAVVLLAHPIGEIHVQYPGQRTPASLYGGTWLNITSLYSGLFFRAEGGNSLAFGAGTQADAFMVHWHTPFPPTSATGGTEGGWGNWFNIGSGSNIWNGSTSPIRDAIDGGFGTPRTANETRPVNQSIRIWKRSA